MRPIRLEISGFGPYSGREVIELERLGNHGLYLITGDTGSGKTSIFDAITYALYGSASGSNRDSESMLRSKYASPDTPTYVELVFDYAGKRYTVRRNPSYKRRSKRGDGFAQEPAGAYFAYPDGREVSGLRDVEIAVADVTGLSEKQFKQIAMIAQGDFMKLITEDTAQRREILRHIFRTENYRRLQEELKQQSSDLKNECEVQRGGLKQVVGGIICGTDDEYAPEVEKLKSELPPVEYITDIIGKILARDKAKSEILSRESEELDERLNEVNIRISAAQDKTAAEREYKRTSQQLSEMQQKRKKISEQLEKEKLRQPELEGLRAELAAINAEMPRYNEKKEQTERISVGKKQFSDYAMKLDKAAAEKASCEDGLAKLKEELAGLDGIGENKAVLTARIEKINNRCLELEKLEKAVTDCEKSTEDVRQADAELKKQQSEHDCLMNKIAELNGKISVMKKRFSELEGCGEERERLLNAQESIQKSVSELEKLAADTDECKKRRSEYIAAAELYRRAAEEADRLNADYDRGYRAFMDNRAGILAAGMKKGEPCPVCGSTEHPCPAKKCEDAPSEAELEALGKKRDKSRKKAEKLSAEASAFRGKADESEAALNTRFAEMLGCDAHEGRERCEQAVISCGEELDGLDKKLAETEKLVSERERLAQEIASTEKKSEEFMKAVSGIDKKLTELRGVHDRSEGNSAQLHAEAMKKAAEVVGECGYDDIREKAAAEGLRLKTELSDNSAKLADEEKKAFRRAELEKLIPESEEKAAELGGRVTELTAAKASSESKLRELENRLRELSGTLRFESGAEAAEYAENVRVRCEEIVSACENAEKAANEAEKQCSAIAGRLEQLTEQLEKFGDIDAEHDTAEKNRLTDEKSVCTEKLGKLHTAISMNETALENIRKGAAELSELENRYSMVKNLADTANGKLSDRSKFMLETYIQTAYFDRIIERANVRLSVMSDGQYTLTRRTEYDEKRAQVGLELDVNDHYNGSVRSVKTLSGGESFKASLSLALGLSDEIQYSAGGIRLDTMFVDEGFGSLDENSLEQAMRALAGLSEGSRLVGIISHVSSLKQRIDKQIIVRKNRDGGSSAELII